MKRARGVGARENFSPAKSCLLSWASTLLCFLPRMISSYTNLLRDGICDDIADAATTNSVQVWLREAKYDAMVRKIGIAK